MTAVLPPFSSEAEQSVLAALLLDNAAIDRIPELRPEHFYVHANRLTFTAISTLLSTGKPADVVTVFERLRATGNDDEAGGLPYVGALASGAVSAANVARHAAIVMDHATARLLMAAGYAAQDAALDQSRPVAERVEEVSASLMKLLESGAQREAVALGDLVLRHTEVIEDRANGRVKYIPTGLTDLDEMLGGGHEPGDLVIIGARPSMGKAQPLDANVLAHDGRWLRMGDLRVGDALASVDGGPSVVTGVFPQGVRQVFRVSFTDGRSAECCAEHLWSVSHRKWAAPRVMSTAEVRAMMARPGMSGRLWVEPLSGDFGSGAELAVDPWLLGALLGDGDFTGRTLRFSKAAAETVGRVRAALPETVEMVPAGGCDYRLSVPRSGGAENPLMASVRSLGLAGLSSADKFIPPIYLAASGPDRLNLLRGLLDTDGWVEKFGAVMYSTSSPRLARDVQALARSLGYWCSMTVTPSSYTHKGERRRGLDQHRLSISGADLDDLFLFEGKRARCADRVRRRRIAFDSIVPAREAECRCIAVSHPTSLYVTDDYIVTHNTAIALTIATHIAGSKPVGLLSMEMSCSQMADREIALLGHINLKDIKRPPTHEPAASQFWSRVSDATEAAAGKLLYIDDQGGLTIAQVRAKARAMKRKHNIAVLLVDYLQLMAGTDPKQSRAYQLEEITRGLKALAKELGIVVIALAQVLRKVETKADGMPGMSDLKDSGAIEQDADVIVFLHRAIVTNPKLSDEWKFYASAFVAKNRQGETGLLHLSYIGHETRFANWSGPPPKGNDMADRQRAGNKKFDE